MITYLMGIVLVMHPAQADFPRPWQISFQAPASPVMEDLERFHTLLLWIEGGIVLCVISLLLYTALRFRASRNKVPSTRTGHVGLEVIWTLIPVVILAVIAFPSFRLLYKMDVVPKADLTLKVVGNQWYWTYDYPDHDIHFDSHMIEEDNLKPGQIRLLEVDKRVIVPIQKNIRVIVASSDVLHSWSVPAFGVKKDAIPGRLNETWFHVTKPGVYYGQCSELCGINHGFMPIVVEAVSQQDFARWLEAQKPPALKKKEL